MGEPLERPLIALAMTSCTWGQPRVTHTPQAGHWRLTRVSPWNDVEAIRTDQGQSRVDPGKLSERPHHEGSYGFNRTHDQFLFVYPLRFVSKHCFVNITKRWYCKHHKKRILSEQTLIIGHKFYVWINFSVKTVTSEKISP